MSALHSQSPRYSENTPLKFPLYGNSVRPNHLMPPHSTATPGPQERNEEGVLQPKPNSLPASGLWASPFKARRDPAGHGLPSWSVGGHVPRKSHWKDQTSTAYRRSSVSRGINTSSGTTVYNTLDHTVGARHMTLPHAITNILSFLMCCPLSACIPIGIETDLSQ